MDANSNLIPSAVVNRFRHKRTKAAWLRILTVASLASILTISSGRFTVAEQRALVEAEKADASRPRQVQRLNRSLAKQLQEITAYETNQLQLRSDYAPLSLFALLAEVKQDLDGQLLVESVDFQLKPPLAAAQNATQCNGTLMMVVVMNGTSNSSKFMQRLREAEYFRDVQLDGAMEKLNPADDDLRFSVRCEF